ncbi:MAG: two-component regulator propeller domain-containing protein [Candidatus Cryptobacteroides sp.]
MKNILHLIFYISSLLLVNTSVYAHQFKKLLPNGTDNSITAIEQDKYGFMWIGTPSGLYRYDGNAYKGYQLYGEDGADFLNSYIRALYKDSEGDIWIGTDSKTVVYCPSKDSFRTVEGGIANRRVNTFCQLDGERILAGTSNGIALIDKTTLLGEMIPDSLCPGIENIGYVSSDRSSDGSIWFITSGSLVKVSEAGDSLEIESWNNKQQTNFIRADKWGRLWFNDGDKIYYFPSVCKKPEPLEPILFTDNTEGHSMVFKDQKAYLGTAYCGLQKFTFSSDGELTDRQSDWIDRNRNELVNMTAATFIDCKGRLWLGTLNGLFIASDKHSESVFKNINIRDGLAHNVVSDVCSDKKGNIWISTSAGLSRLGFKDGKTVLKTYKNPSLDNMAVVDNRLQSIIIDGNGLLWIGTKRGIVNFDTGTERFYTNSDIDFFVKSRNGYYPKSIYRDSLDNIYMGFVSGGLFIWNASSRKITRLPLQDNRYLHSAVNAIIKDTAGDLWFESEHIGLVRIPAGHLNDPVINDFEIWQDITSDDSQNGRTHHINNIICCSHGTILCGTSKGLYRFLPEKKQFERIKLNYSDDDNYICSITEDRNGICWVFTTTGVFRYDPRDIDFPIYMELNDGFFARNDYINGSCISEKGIIFSSGICGVTWFNPEDISKDITPSTIYISDFSIINRRITPDGRHIEGNVNEVEHINIYHEDSQFSFEFTTLDYEQNRKAQYSYKLDNFDKNWYSVSGGYNYVSYSNLSPGDYTLRVKATNDYGMWTENEKQISITVLPPWWETVWFRLLIFTTVCIIVFFAVRWGRMRYNQRQNEKFKEFKLDFYGNIINGLSTPLTILQGAASEMINSDERDRKRLISLMGRNVRKLSDMVHQIIEFRKVNDNSTLLNLVEMDIIPFVTRICEYLTDYFKANGLALSFSSSINTAVLTFDPEMIETVIMNLLQNSLNYTPKGGAVSVSCRNSPDGKHLMISVKDNGIGIRQEDREKIFERNWQTVDSRQRQTMSGGIGIGLFLSKSIMELHHGTIRLGQDTGTGSEFIINLSYDNGCFRNHRINKEISDPIEPDFTRQFAEIQQIYDDGSPETDSQEQSGGNIAIITSNNDLYRLIYLILKNFHVIQITSLKSVQHDFQEQCVRLVLFDTAFCDNDTSEDFCNRLKGQNNTRHIPLILLTNDQTKDTVVRYYKIGVDSIIGKPFDGSYVNAVVTQLLESRKIIQEKIKLDIISNKVQDKEVVSADERIMNQIMSIAEKHLSDEDFTLATFADEMHMSRSVLHAKIQTLTGKPPMDFIKGIRMNKAAQLLETNSFNIMQVSCMVGYSDSRYFSTCFKKTFGLSPREYVAAHKKQL